MIFDAAQADIDYGGDYDYKHSRNVKLKKSSGRGGVLKAAISGVIGSVVGNWMRGRGNKKYAKEKKDLMQYIQMQEDVNRQRDEQWQEEYQKLYSAYEKLETETLERDYEEFKAPDTNNDDMISRQEFNIYVRKYLSSFPELTEKDFPKFEEFDLNGDGIVSFDEWQKFLKLQKQAEKEKESGGVGSGSGKGNAAYSNLLDQMYTQSSGSDSFNNLQANINQASKAQHQQRQQARAF